MLKTDSLRVFLAIAQHEHIGLAAKQLRLTPSATSHSLTTLERYLGTQLFDRVGRNISLNSEGRLFHSWVEPTVERLHEIEARFTQRSGEPKGLIKITASQSLADHKVATVIGRLMSEFSLVSFEIQAGSSKEALDAVDSNLADIAIAYMKTLSPDDIRIGTANVVPVVRKGHPVLQLPEDMRWSKLDDYPVAIPANLQYGKISGKEIAAKIDKHFGQRMIFNNYESATRYLESSDAWSFFPDWLVKYGASSLAILSDSQFSLSFEIGLRHSKRCDSRIVNAIVKGMSSPA